MHWLSCTVVPDLPQVHISSRMQIIIDRPSTSPLRGRLFCALVTNVTAGSIGLYAYLDGLAPVVSRETQRREHGLRAGLHS